MRNLDLSCVRYSLRISAFTPSAPVALPPIFATEQAGPQGCHFQDHYRPPPLSNRHVIFWGKYRSIFLRQRSGCCREVQTKLIITSLKWQQPRPEVFTIGFSAIATYNRQ